MENIIQFPQEGNVWAEIVGSSTVGLFFIEGTFTSEKYLELQNYITPSLCNWCNQLFRQIRYEPNRMECPHTNRKIRDSFMMFFQIDRSQRKVLSNSLLGLQIYTH